VKELPVREIKKFVKIAKVQGVEKAIEATPNDPYLREYQEIDSCLKKLLKRVSLLKAEGIEVDDFPETTRKLMDEFMQLTDMDFTAPPKTESMEVSAYQ